MSDNNIEVKVSADSTAVKTGMDQAAQAVKQSVEQMNEHMAALSNAFQSAMGPLKAFAAILAGGAIFKEGINAAKNLTDETLRLSKSLGMNMEDASTLNVALKSIGSSAEAFSGASAMLSRQLRSNEDGLKAMGLQTRDASGNLRNMKDLMFDSLGVLRGYKEGTDRTLAAQTLFGRGAAEAMGFLKLNNNVMEEAEKRAAALGLVFGPEQAAKVKAYKDAMEHIHLVLEALQEKIGQAVMPVMTQMAKWFSDIGPAVVGVFRVAMQAVADVFQIVMDLGRDLWETIKDVFSSIGELIGAVAGGDVPGAMEVWRNAMILVRVAALALKEGIVLAVEVIRGSILAVVEVVKGFAAVAQAAFRLDWDGVKSAAANGALNVERVIAESQKRIVEKTRQNAEEMKRVLNGETANPTSPAVSQPSGNRTFSNPNKNESDMLRAQFAIIKAQMEGELAIQKEYLKQAQEAYAYAYKNNQVSTEEYFAAKLSIEQQGFRDSIRIKEEELKQTQALEARASKPQDKLALKAQEIKLTSELTVLNAQAAQVEIKNAREVTDALRQKRDALAEITRVSTQQAATTQIDLERIQIQQRAALREITHAQELQQERDLQERLYQIDLTAMRERLELINNDPIKRAQINAEIEQLERQHKVKMAEIDKQIAIESSQFAVQAQGAIQQSFGSMLNDLQGGAKSLGQVFNDLFKNIERSISNLVSQKIAKNIMSGSGEGGEGGFGSLIGSFLGSFDVGTSYVPRDGLAMIHKGERIVTAKDNASGNYGGKSSTTNINISVPDGTNRQTAQQIAQLTGMAMQRAMARNS